MLGEGHLLESDGTVGAVAREEEEEEENGNDDLYRELTSLVLGFRDATPLPFLSDGTNGRLCSESATENC